MDIQRREDDDDSPTVLVNMTAQTRKAVGDDGKKKTSTPDKGKRRKSTLMKSLSKRTGRSMKGNTGANRKKHASSIIFSSPSQEEVEEEENPLSNSISLPQVSTEDGGLPGSLSPRGTRRAPDAPSLSRSHSVNVSLCARSDPPPPNKMPPVPVSNRPVPQRPVPSRAAKDVAKRLSSGDTSRVFASSPPPSGARPTVPAKPILPLRPDSGNSRPETVSKPAIPSKTTSGGQRPALPAKPASGGSGIVKKPDAPSFVPSLENTRGQVPMVVPNKQIPLSPKSKQREETELVVPETNPFNTPVPKPESPKPIVNPYAPVSPRKDAYCPSPSPMADLYSSTASSRDSPYSPLSSSGGSSPRPKPSSSLSALQRSSSSGSGSGSPVSTELVLYWLPTIEICVIPGSRADEGQKVFFFLF